MTSELSNVSDVVSTQQNIAGTKSSVLTIQPEDGTGLIIKGMVAAGEEVGFPVYATLYNQNGNLMDLETELSWQFERPGDDDPTTVTYPLTNIRPYRTLSIKEQQDAQKVDAVKHVIKGTKKARAEGKMPRIGIGHLDTLDLMVTSPDVVDWSHPETKVYVDRNAVEEV